MAENCVTSLQIRAARVLLNMSQEQLASLCEFSIMTIQKAEKNIESVRKLYRDKIIFVLQQNGIDFTFPDEHTIGLSLKLKK